MKYVIVARFLGREVLALGGDDLVDNLLCAGAWLYRDALGYVSMVPMGQVFTNSQGAMVVTETVFQAGIQVL